MTISPTPQADSVTGPPESAGADAAWLAEAALIVSALEAAGGVPERRDRRRMRYHAVAALRLFVSDPAAPDTTIFTRDVSLRGAGFVVAQRIPLGYGGVVRLPLPCGRTTSIPCTVLRCRSVSPGWYEGALLFNREQPEFQEE